MHNTLRLDELKQKRSEELNRPKAKNLRKDEEGNIIDTRTPRDEELIKDCHNKINAL